MISANETAVPTSGAAVLYAGDMAPTELQGLIDEAIDKAKDDLAQTLTASLNASLRSAFFAVYNRGYDAESAWKLFLSYLEDPNG